MPRHPLTLAAIAAALLTVAMPAAAATGDEPRGEIRLRGDDRQAATTGPLATANALSPGLAPATPSAAVAMAWAGATVRRERVALTGEIAATQQRSGHGDVSGDARFNEAFLAADLGAWQLGGGRKVVSWDVGYGFRPNDVVQQERRRALIGERLEGREVLDAEHFGAADALTLVAVQPQRWSDAADDARGAEESALAARAYRRFGGLDAYGFARWGRHTGWSLGAAGAWVAGDSLELHASARWLHAHDGWTTDDPSSAAPLAANPWRTSTLPGGQQWLIGANWTGTAQQGVLIEAWHDGTTLSDMQWNDWGARNRALAAGPAPSLARAGNLAWQASPLDAASLRRDNLFVRLSWQPTPWLVALDTLLTPADHGRLVTASLQWQGDRWHVEAAWRIAGGPADALIRQTPVRRSASLAATWAW